jgi:GxxExxY protein
MGISPTTTEEDNKNRYYDNNDNINQQLATESYSEADRSTKWEIRTSSVAKEKKIMNIELMQELIYPIVGVLHDVRTELGPGLNESVYQEGLELELKAQEIPYEREKMIRPTYRGVIMDAMFRMDFVCIKHVIVECKAVHRLNADHRAQLFNYMRLTKLRMGILVNFAPAYMEIERYFYDPATDDILTYKGEKLKSVEVNTVFVE